MKDPSTIAISKNTKEKIAKLGKFGQSYEDILKELLEQTGEKIT